MRSWEDPDAAARVDLLASGNETAPTPPTGARQALGGIGWSLAAAAVWMVLALTHPSTTYHFAPLLTAAAWPVAASREAGRATGGALGLLSIMGAALHAVAVLGVLAIAGALEGPALIGSTAGEESVAMIAAGTLISALFTWSRAPSVDQRSDSATATTSTTGG